MELAAMINGLFGAIALSHAQHLIGIDALDRVKGQQKPGNSRTALRKHESQLRARKGPAAKPRVKTTSEECPQVLPGTGEIPNSPLKGGTAKPRTKSWVRDEAQIQP
jgi:hypothetical protein